MKPFFLALIVIAIHASVIHAQSKEEVQLALEFERMKLRSNYTSDLKKTQKEGQLFILWVSHEDPKLFKWLKANRPDAIHCFVESSKLHDVQPGVVVGIRRNAQVEQAKTLSVSELATLKTGEVIQYSLGLPPGIPASSNVPAKAGTIIQPGCPGGVTPTWTGFKH